MNFDDLVQATDLDALPRACPDRPRVAARIKAEPEDFEVEEIPAYAPSGQGDHLYLWIEKRDRSGGDLLRRVANALGLAPQDVGAAGTKDRRAVTRQWLSVPADREARLGHLAGVEGVRVLATARHDNKLRTGHLVGNRFRILLRDAPADALDALSGTARLLADDGFFNLFGAQRFGRQADTLVTGLGLLAPAEGARRPRLGRFEYRMVVSSIQSALFNRWVAERVGRGLDRTVLAGDVMGKTATGGLFRVEDVAAEQARLDAGETRITGPIYGHRMMAAVADAGTLEADVLERAGLTLDAFKVFGALAEGTRRPLRVRPSDFEVAARPDGILLAFTLPKGCYASVLLREFVDGAQGPADADL